MQHINSKKHQNRMGAKKATAVHNVGSATCFEQLQIFKLSDCEIKTFFHALGFDPLTTRFPFLKADSH